MTVLKRMTARVGGHALTGTVRVGSCRIPGTPCILHTEGWVCPRCHRQSELTVANGKLVCALCGEA